LSQPNKIFGRFRYGRIEVTHMRDEAAIFDGKARGMQA
jgi:hypothetical protein